MGLWLLISALYLIGLIVILFGMVSSSCVKVALGTAPWVRLMYGLMVLLMLMVYTFGIGSLIGSLLSYRLLLLRVAFVPELKFATRTWCG